MHWDGSVATLTVSGELDLTTAPDLREHLLNVAALHPERLVLDLGGLVFVDVAGARTLDRAYRALAKGCEISLHRPRPSARKLFGFSGLMDV